MEQGSGSRIAVARTGSMRVEKGKESNVVMSRDSVVTGLVPRVKFLYINENMNYWEGKRKVILIT